MERRNARQSAGVYHLLNELSLKKQIAILGSTGSIGTQALEIIRSHPGLFGVEVLTAHGNCDLLIAQAREFLPGDVVIVHEPCYAKVSEALADLDIRVHTGEEALSAVTELEGVDLVLSALVGYSGLKPALHAIRAGKDLALANKESLVVAGDLLMAEARRKGVSVLPVDSEHSAIFQCLAGEDKGSVEKIYLTASGGPFFGKSLDELAGITKQEALAHPNWKMGPKVTIDSASLMNKGLEVIEAKWLFDLDPARIEVVIHPQSVIHSMVQFIDGSVKAQLGPPDMKLPILYALSYPNRTRSEFPRFSIADYPRLTFHRPDPEIFRNLTLAFEALGMGGNMPCILNAANEIAVRAFLDERIGFLRIPDVIEHCMKTVPFEKSPGYEEYVATHRQTLVRAEEYLYH